MTFPKIHNKYGFAGWDYAGYGKNPEGFIAAPKADFGVQRDYYYQLTSHADKPELTAAQEQELYLLLADLEDSDQFCKRRPEDSLANKARRALNDPKNQGKTFEEKRDFLRNYIVFSYFSELEKRRRSTAPFVVDGVKQFLLQQPPPSHEDKIAKIKAALEEAPVPAPAPASAPIAAIPAAAAPARPAPASAPAARQPAPSLAAAAPASAPVTPRDYMQDEGFTRITSYKDFGSNRALLRNGAFVVVSPPFSPGTMGVGVVRAARDRIYADSRVGTTVGRLPIFWIERPAAGIKGDYDKRLGFVLDELGIKSNDVFYVKGDGDDASKWHTVPLQKKKTLTKRD